MKATSGALFCLWIVVTCALVGCYSLNTLMKESAARITALESQLAELRAQSSARVLSALPPQAQPPAVTVRISPW